MFPLFIVILMLQFLDDILILAAVVLKFVFADMVIAEVFLIPVLIDLNLSVELVYALEGFRELLHRRWISHNAIHVFRHLDDVAEFLQGFPELLLDFSKGWCTDIIRAAIGI